jgi:hypothetical protein
VIKQVVDPALSVRRIAHLVMAIIVIAFAFLILTKSRTTLLSLIAALLFTQIAVSRSVGA